MTVRPPALAEWLVARTLGDEDRDAVLGDLAEEFGERVRAGDPRAARRWYWRQCRRSAVSNLRGRWVEASVRGAREGRRPSGDFSGGVMRDIRDAWRSLRGSPSFSVVALVVLTLGIGASTAIFSVVDAVVLSGVPFAGGGRLVGVSQLRTNPGGPARTTGVAPQDFGDWVARQTAFEGLAATTTANGMTAIDGRPANSKAVRVTANLFSLLRAAPARGALFTAANEQAGADHVVLLSDGFWRRQFGASPDVVGRNVAIDGASWQIVGVMPPAFMYPLSRTGAPTADMWIPYVMGADDHVRGRSHSSVLQVVGRLKPGVSVEQAQAEIRSVDADLARQFPDWYVNRMTQVQPLLETIVGRQIQSWMLMLLASVAFVLLIACVNVASLMIARATARSREMSVRAALGASQWQLVRAVLTESLLLSVTAAAGGVAGTYALIGAMRATLPANLPRANAIVVNWRVLAAAIVVSIVTGLVCGLLPALQGSRPDLSRALRDGRRAGGASLARQRLRALLVAAEVALAVILLVGAGLFISSFVRLSGVDLGFNYEHVLTVGVDPAPAGPGREARAAAAARVAPIVAQALPIVRAMPGVQFAAALSGTRPLEGGNDRANVVIRGHEQEFTTEADAVDLYFATADYAAALGTPLVRGRFLRPDEMGDVPVLVLNETAAARFFPGADPIGQTIGILGGERTVVGIVHDVRAGGPETGMRPEAYLPFEHAENPHAYIVVRTTGDPAALVTPVKSALRSLAPDLPLADVTTLEDFFARIVAQRRFNMLLIGAFGALALAIAAVGVYGMMAFVVEQRTSEIGVRMALGARPGEVVAMIVRRASLIIGAGVAAGLVVAWPLAQTIGAFLFRVQPHDAVVYASATAVLMAAGLIAAFAPARRAARVDPIVALRAE